MINLFVLSVFFQALLLYSVNANTSPGNGPVADPNAPYDLSNNPLLPTECGKQFSQSSSDGVRANLGEYPWMVLLEYETVSGITTECGGVLISKRYVLTATHCLNQRLKYVRLGEDDTDTNPDCRQDESKTTVCADKVIKVGVEEQIKAKDYVINTQRVQNNIALIRLIRDVSFTNYVQPICLPSNGSIGDNLFSPGWGAMLNAISSNAKLKVSLPYVAKNECQRIAENLGVELTPGEICIGGQGGQDACTPDSGGALMEFKVTPDGKGQWTVVGISSWGMWPCGMPGIPRIYTEVSMYVSRILSKMRP